MSYGALFLSMAVLAAVPSLSVLLVTTLAARGGLRQGAAAAGGVVAGDIVFITVAMFGLSVLGNLPPLWSGLLKVAAGIWLCYCAWMIASSRTEKESVAVQSQWGTLGAFGAGLLLTLSDQKAILFYLGFLPGFLDAETVSIGDWLMVVAITCVAVGGVKLLYVLGATRARRRLGPATGRLIQTVGALVVAIAGLGVLVDGLLMLWL